MPKTITATVNTKIAAADPSEAYPNGYLDVIPTDNFRNANGDQFDAASLQWPLKDGGSVRSDQLDGSQVLDLPAFFDHSRSVRDMIGGASTGSWDGENNVPTLRIGLTALENGQTARTLAQEGYLGHNISLTYSTNDEDFTFKDGIIYDANVDEVSVVWKGANQDARVIAVASKDSENSKEEKIVEEKAKEAAKLDFDPTADAEFAKAVAAEVARINQEAGKPEEKPQQEDNNNAPEAPAAKSAGVEEEEEKTVEKTAAKKEIEAAKARASEKEAAKSVIEAADNNATMDKVELTSKQFVAFVNKDTQKLAELNKAAIETYKTAASTGFLNTQSTADGGAIVPSAELLTDVYTNLGVYSQVANDLNVITLEKGDSLDVATLVTDVIMTEVGTEGGQKKVTKTVLGDGDVSLREFAGVAVITKKLVRQAAVNVYNIVRDSFARAIASKRAEMALTDTASGIINKTGVAKVTAASATAVTWNDIKKLPYAIPAAAVQGGKYYISRAVLEALDTAQDSTGRDLNIVTLDGNGLSGRFSNGFAFAVEDKLTGASSEAVFGAMGRFGILLRQANVEDETFDTGTVVDGDVTHNLLQENKLAERVAFYENVGYPLPGSFAKLVDPA